MLDRCTTIARSLKRGFARLALLGSTTSFLAACQAPSAAKDAERPLEFLVTNDADTLDPRHVTETVGLRTSRLIHAGLTHLDPDTLRPVPYLAASYRWVDPLTLDVTLRDGVRFHSGAPFTAEDVVATVEAFGDAKVGSRHASAVEAIARATVTAPLTVRFVLKRPHATLLADLDLPILRHDQALGPPDPSGAVLDGLGPFEIDHVTRGEILLRPARYGVARTPPHSIAIRTVHDENARALRLHSGRADVAQNAISPTLLPALDHANDLTLRAAPGANLSYLVLRVDRGPLAHVELRRAIALGIDRQTITDDLFGHRATPADTFLPAGHWATPEDVPPQRFDPVAARALVSRAGPETTPLTLLTSTDRLRLTVARTMAQELGDVGLDVEVVPLELGTLLARLNAGDFDLASLQLPELAEPNTLRVFLHSAFIPPNGANRGRVRDAALDELLDVGDQNPDEHARIAAYAAMEARLRDQLFIIPLWHEDQVAVLGPRAQAYAPSRDGRWLALATLP